MDAITHNKPKKLTDKQIQFFANKLAHHDPFASKKAAVGESYADLEKRLLIELQDVEFVRKYAGVLCVGLYQINCKSLSLKLSYDSRSDHTSPYSNERFFCYFLILTF